MVSKYHFDLDYYERLGVDPSADEETLRTQYRLLTRIFHPDVNSSPEAHQQFVRLREAYDVLSDPKLRTKYDAWLAQQMLDVWLLRVVVKPGPKTLRRSAGHQRLYALVELEVMDQGKPSSSSLPLNLILVLDRSSSMRGERLYHAQKAVHLISEKLTHHDRIGIVTFNDRAQVVLPAGPYRQPEVVISAINSITPSGGTEISAGLEAGFEEALRGHSRHVISHIIFLTDGQTYGDEARCLELAEKIAREQIGLTLFGLGADWNDSLLDEMARRANGETLHIADPQDAVTAFEKRLDVLRRTAAHETNLTITLQPHAELLAAHQVMPALQRLTPTANGTAKRVKLGQLLKGLPVQVLLEFGITPPAHHHAVIAAHIAAETKLIKENISTEQTRILVVGVRDIGAEELEFQDEIVSAAERVAALRLQQRAWEAMEKGNRLDAELRLSHLATRFLEIGEPTLAALTKRELALLRRTGALSSEGSKRIKYGTRLLSLPAPDWEQAP